MLSRMKRAWRSKMSSYISVDKCNTGVLDCGTEGIDKWSGTPLQIPDACGLPNAKYAHRHHRKLPKLALVKILLGITGQRV